jgi:putative redox protein
MEAIVKETGEGRFAQAVVLGKHTFVGDEPVAAGGGDLGPSPYEFLLAALGTCTSITLRMYADLKKIPLERVIVKLSHQKIHAEDCKDCDKPTALIDHIDRIIELQGDLTEEQREKLLEIANKCPVHKTLTSKVSITTALLK